MVAKSVTSRQETPFTTGQMSQTRSSNASFSPSCSRTTMASIKQRPDGTWRARYRGPDGRENAKHAKLKRDAQSWLDEATAAMRAGSWVDPSTSRITMGEWLDRWLAGYASKKPRTVIQAKTHAAIIRQAFSERQLRTIRPSDVETWIAELQKTYATSYVYALHARLSQILADAVHDGILNRKPVQPPHEPTSGRAAAVRRHHRPGMGSLRRTAEGLPEPATAGRLRWPPRGRSLRTRGRRCRLDRRHDNTRPAARGREPEDERVARDDSSPARASRLAPRGRRQCGRRARSVRAWRDRLPARKDLDRRTRPHRRPARSIPNPRPAPLLRVHADRRRARRASSAGSAAARIPTVTLNTYGHLWPDADDTSRAAVARILTTRKSPQSADSEGSSGDSAD